jgi:hypothetical protein
MKALERCPKCNALIALVGRVHNCRNPVLAELKSLPAPPVKKPVVKDADKEGLGNDPSTRGARPSTKFDRVGYQREYMRKRRDAKKKEGAAAAIKG